VLTLIRLPILYRTSLTFNIVELQDREDLIEPVSVRDVLD